AVRAWLKATLTPIGIPVFDALYKSEPASDQILFLTFGSDAEVLTFGQPALVQTTYTPDLLLLLLDPSAEDAQYTLDLYVQQVRQTLRAVVTPVSITDPTTGAPSDIVMIGAHIPATPAKTEDMGPVGEEGDALASVILRPQLVEFSTQ